MKLSGRLLCLTSVLSVIAGAAIADERTYDLPTFDRIDVSAGVKLVAVAGKPQSVTVYADEGDFSDFEIQVRNGELRATREYSRLSWHKPKSRYEVRVSVRDLRGIEASSGSFGRIENVDTADFRIDISSGAKMVIDGECGSCNIDLSSGASLSAEDLTCGRANIDVSSGGRGDLTVLDSIVADASSGGNVRVYGNPPRVNVDKSSGGSIKVVRFDSASSR